MRKKQDITPRNADGQPHGLWIRYWDNGNVRYKRRYVNGRLHGIYEFYWGSGELSYKEYWINNKGKYLYTEWYYGVNRIRFDI